jgi:hypothetical protein
MNESRLEAIAGRYKALIASRYRALRLTDIDQISHGNCFVSPKIDGELWLAEINNDSVQVFARGGRRLAAGPIHEALMEIATTRSAPIIVAGELHSHTPAGRRPRVGEVAEALAAEAFSGLDLTLFDVVEVDGEQPPNNYSERLELLQALLPEPLKHLRVVETELLAEPNLLGPCIKRWVESGKAEGLVVRSSLGNIYKLKPSFSIDAIVVGFTTRAGTPDQVRSLLVGLLRPDGTTHLLGACGNFPSETMRQELLRELEPRECRSDFRHSSSDGNLYRFVQPELVVEISCTDLQTEDSNGDLVRRWVLRHTAAQGWQPLVAMPIVSLIHPVLVRRRTDKSGDALDVRLSQLNEQVPLRDLDAKAVPLDLPRSELVQRRVWKKDGKGGLAVRKFLVWKTSKERVWPGWPAWVVHFTDYSPDRKTRLERTIRTAQNKADALVIAEALVAENIKKGWEEVALPQAPPPSRETKTKNKTATAKAPASTKKLKQKP